MGMIDKCKLMYADNHFLLGFPQNKVFSSAARLFVTKFDV